MQTLILEKQEPFSKEHPTQFSFDSGDLPPGSEPVAAFRTNTYSNSVYCRFDELIELARKEAAGLGGDFILIDHHEKPNLQNSCHNFSATLYRTPQPGEPVFRPPPTHTATPKTPPDPASPPETQKAPSEETVQDSTAVAAARAEDTKLPDDEAETGPADRQAAENPNNPEQKTAEEETRSKDAPATQEEPEATQEPAPAAPETTETERSQPEKETSPPFKRTKVWDDEAESAYLARKRREDQITPYKGQSTEKSRAAEREGEATPEQREAPKGNTGEKSPAPPAGGGYFGYEPKVNTGTANQRESESRVALDSMSRSPVGFFSVYGGFGRRLAPLPEGLPPALETFLDETRRGHVFGAELVFRVAPRNYLGVQLDRFSSSHGEVFVVDNGNAAAQGTWQENTSVTFVGLNYTMTTVPSVTGTHFFLGLSLGASMYKNQGTMPYEIDDEPVFVPFTYSGSTLSLGINAGVNIALADNLFLRIGANLFTGVLTEMDGEINGNTAKLEFESGEGEGLIRGSLSAGISLAF